MCSGTQLGMGAPVKSLGSEGRATEYSIVWTVDGEERRHTFEEFPVFVGRLPRSCRGRVDEYDVIGVYVYYPRLGRGVFTGLRYATVSRFHAEFVQDGGHLFVVDHGAEGRGSRNGTFVNGRRVEPGGRARLKPGDSIKLGSSGPVFVLVARIGSEEFIRLGEGVPTQMPLTLAKRLGDAGVAEVRPYSGSEALVVPRIGGGHSTVAGGLVVIGERVGRREQLLKALHVAGLTIREAVERLEKHHDVEGAQNRLLSLEPILQRLMKEDARCGKITELYENVIRDLESGLVDEALLTRKLRQLERLIDGLIIAL